MPGRHRPAHLPPRDAEIRTNDRHRGSASERGYGWPWAKAAKGHLRNHPLCVGCEAEGRVMAAELVDHTEPHKGDTTKFWDKANWQGCCKWHHDVVKQKLERMWLAGAIRAADLRLDSAVAVAMSRQMRR
jgi:5-methylcytosine-specific restriction protein A